MLAVALVGMALAGSGRGLGDVAQVTLIQARAADEVRSRVFAAQDGLSHLAFTVSAFSGGLLVTLASARGAFAVAAACGVAAACLRRGPAPTQRQHPRCVYAAAASAASRVRQNSRSCGARTAGSG